MSDDEKFGGRDEAAQRIPPRPSAHGWPPRGSAILTRDFGARVNVIEEKLVAFLGITRSELLAWSMATLGPTPESAPHLWPD